MYNIVFIENLMRQNNKFDKIFSHSIQFILINQQFYLFINVKK
ncbi:hypothetical protein pb186bvf_006219 [Paramecium bursaria]